MDASVLDQVVKRGERKEDFGFLQKTSGVRRNIVKGKALTDQVLDLLYAEQNLRSGGKGVQNDDLFIRIFLQRHISCRKSAVHAAGQLRGNGDRDRAVCLFKLRQPCVRRGAGGVAGRAFLLHGGEHFQRIQMLVIDKIPLSDADGKWHTGQPDPSVRTGGREQITA